MGINSFWLFYIEADSILVALINWGNGRFYVASIGPRVAFNINNPSSIAKAADESLSSAAISADISPEQEPLFVGLVIPSSWVGEDGKIVKEKSEIILPLLKELDLKPSGFMSSDEAIIEESSKPDDFPASFINIYLESNSFELSLVYLGKIKKRVRKFFDGEFTAQLIEDTLLEFNSESTLPPQIYIYGNADESTVEELKNFSWVGKKNVETFLHFPDIKLYRDEDLVNIFFKAITSQMIGGGNPSHQSVPSIPPEEPEEKENETQEDIETPDEIINNDSDIYDAEITENIEEVSPENLGFTKEQPKEEFIEVPIIPETPVFETNIPSRKPSIPFSFPKINFKLPKLKTNFLIFLLPVALILIFLLIFFSKAKIILFLTPYEFEKTINITLDSDATEISSSIIPVEKKDADVSSSITVETTGQKTVGTKATGEVTIFNKLEKVQNIPKGSILTDSNGQKFELINSVQVAAAVINYNTGTMNFGQTKTSLSALDIGSEYNISKDVALTFKDFSENSIVVKSNTTFAGGTKEQVRAVSKQDKSKAESQLTQKLADEADKKISEELNNSSDILKETIQVKKGKIEFNREVDEQTDELTATAQSTVSVFAINSEIKNKIIEQFLSQESGYSDSDKNPESFVFTFKISKLDTDQATGSLTVKGSSLPKIDTATLKKNIAGKTVKNAQKIIKKTISRVYDFNIQTNSKLLNILPFNKNNISIDVKIKSK
ncbi:MAG: hypothetical protein PHP97_02790 [Candidatus Shapirobacteria bacterium]|nr:hypothetical protein [Candidatus Shapirobacteria bacterium]MDD3002358.1 hypothetical protein [Candidatus Shapirobacteria bacterium]MDD4383334.1 hypothetical protein [Candidatus Shapirobacteria bacterium]